MVLRRFLLGKCECPQSQYVYTSLAARLVLVQQLFLHCLVKLCGKLFALFGTAQSRDDMNLPVDGEKIDQREES